MAGPTRRTGVARFAAMVYPLVAGRARAADKVFALPVKKARSAGPYGGAMGPLSPPERPSNPNRENRVSMR